MKKIKLDPCYIITKFSWFKFFRNPPFSSPFKFPIIILHERYSIRTHVWKIWEGSQIETENGGVSFSSCIRGPWWAMIIFFLNSRSMSVIMLKFSLFYIVSHAYYVWFFISKVCPMVKYFCLLAIVHYLKTTYDRKQATAVGLEKDIVYSVRQRKIPTRNRPNSE